MDQLTLDALLKDLPLASIRYFDRVDSTNNLAARWAKAGAPDLSLVVADEQTAGRGRLDRRWFTPPGAGVAFSLVMREFDWGSLQIQENLPRLTALGTLAVCDVLNRAFPVMLPAQIKWPNDVVATRRKLAGVLAEAHWQGEQLQFVILGVGINIAPPSVPPKEELDFPATCVEAVLDQPVDRWRLFHDVLAELLLWRAQLNSPEFIQAWERNLAFRMEWVEIVFEERSPLVGQIVGLSPDGGLRLHTTDGKKHTLTAGEIKLRPVDRSTK